MKLGNLLAQFQAFSQPNTFIPPEQILLGEREDFRRKKNKTSLVKLKTTA